ncbi:unnamed protein product [Rhodiola kirilowii]
MKHKGSCKLSTPKSRAKTKDLADKWLHIFVGKIYFLAVTSTRVVGLKFICWTVNFKLWRREEEEPASITLPVAIFNFLFLVRKLVRFRNKWVEADPGDQCIDIMAEEPPPPPIRLMNFVSEEQLDEVKRTRGERVEDGTAQRDRPLFESSTSVGVVSHCVIGSCGVYSKHGYTEGNKDKKDAEFNERFKHRPPKALDEDETEFLDNLEMSRREYEKQLARDEDLQLRSFQAAVAAQIWEHNPAAKKNTHPRPVNVIIKVKPQAKKPKIVDPPNAQEQPTESLEINAQEPQGKEESPNGKTDSFNDATKLGLVSYSDESDDD